MKDNIGRVSTYLIAIGSSWNAAQVDFWVQGDGTEWSAAKSRQLRQRHLWHRFTFHEFAVELRDTRSVQWGFSEVFEFHGMQTSYKCLAKCRWTWYCKYANSVELNSPKNQFLGVVYGNPGESRPYRMSVSHLRVTRNAKQVTFTPMTIFGHFTLEETFRRVMQSNNLFFKILI